MAMDIDIHQGDPTEFQSSLLVHWFESLVPISVSGKKKLSRNLQLGPQNPVDHEAYWFIGFAGAFKFSSVNYFVTVPTIMELNGLWVADVAYEMVSPVFGVIDNGGGGRCTWVGHDDSALGLLVLNFMPSPFTVLQEVLMVVVHVLRHRRSWAHGHHC
ncbi:hypothetical protein F0562_002013 [Nyssa sinensis]|uniref:Uncharacterized protein n=1 Tax=Nyssa sinensis TaxID=561372 RepID=A0A5J5C594_9ASTE|nr:hypothetical protein F0562_002013 [Nyssa sinensis]